MHKFKILIGYLRYLMSSIYFFRSNRNCNKWVFGEWFGKRFNDNCFYLCKYISQHYPKLQLYWVANEGASIESLPSRIKRVVSNSKEAIGLLKEAGIVIVNEQLTDFGDFWIYSGGACSVNLWHGAGDWKRVMGDIYPIRELIHFLYLHVWLYLFSAKYIISQSDKQSRMWQRSLWIPRSRILQVGQPRCSIFYDKMVIAETREKVYATLRKTSENEIDSSCKIVSYMPTFRDKVANSFSFEQIAQDKRLFKILEENNVYIVQKSHFVTNERNEVKNGVSGRIITIDDINTQELLAATDLLITDYSSVFWDFLLLDRPIVYYMYDYNYYANKDRGFNRDRSEVVAGDVTENVDDLLIQIEDNLRNPDKHKNLRELRRREYLTYESSDSCEKICQFIFKKLKLNPADFK